MRIRNNFGNVVAAAIGILGIGYAWGAQKKVNQVAERLDISVKKLSANCQVDIDDAIAEEVLREACKRAAQKAIENVKTEVRSDFRKEIRNAVETEVKAQYETVKDSVSKELDRQVSDLDISAIRERVVKNAEEKAMQKLDGCLDGVLDKYNRELQSVGKIYQSIAEQFKRTV